MMADRKSPDCQETCPQLDKLHDNTNDNLNQLKGSALDTVLHMQNRLAIRSALQS